MKRLSLIRLSGGCSATKNVQKMTPPDTMLENFIMAALMIHSIARVHGRIRSTMRPMKSGADLCTRLELRGLGLRLGNGVPDKTAETTHGVWESFHERKHGDQKPVAYHPACLNSRRCLKCNSRASQAVGIRSNNLLDRL